MTRELKRSRDETFKMNAHGLPINNLGARRPVYDTDRSLFSLLSRYQF
jgi:hypothetical protein